MEYKSNLAVLVVGTLHFVYNRIFMQLEANGILIAPPHCASCSSASAVVAAAATE